MAPGGQLVLALYRRTLFYRFWAIEKRLYARFHPAVQAAIHSPFKLALLARVLAAGWNPIAHVRCCRSHRGMGWSHDVHDWLGGYPYESVRPAELRAFLAACGLAIVRALESSTIGVFGSGCDGWVATRPP